jgi:hypothetical protein
LRIEIAGTLDALQWSRLSTTARCILRRHHFASASAAHV